MERDLTKPQNIQLTTTVKEIGGDGSRILEFIASTENPDRSNDIIDVAGWDLKAWNANSIFAWSHDYSKLPVGKGVSATRDIRAKMLTIRVKFPTIEEISDINHPSEEALFADTVYKMYKNGYLNAVSVGFKGLEFEVRNDDSVKDKAQWDRGLHFKKAELLEVSAVLVPCNADALVTMRGMKSFSQSGIALVEKLLTAQAAEDKMEVEKIAELEERIKSLEEGSTIIKAGSKFSKDSKEAIRKVSEAIKACHKGVKACGDALDKMIEDAPIEEQSGTEGSANDTSDGREEPRPNTEDSKSAIVETVKQFEIATASIEDAMKLFEGETK